MSKRKQVLPPGWLPMTLNDVVEVQNTAIRPREHETYTYLGLEDIAQHTGTILAAPATKGREIRSTKYVFNATHVLYGKLRPNLNKVALPSFDGICSTDILPLAPKPNALRDYIAFFLRTPAFVAWATNAASGTKMPRIGITRFLSAPIPVPPLPVQERIVEILTKVDDIRRKRQEALDLADSIIAAAFVSMFGDPLNNAARFDRMPLGELADVRSGVTKGRKLQGKETVEVPYLRVANVQDGFLDLDEMKTIRVLPDDTEKYRLEDGDILMTEGGDPDKLGRGAIWREQIDGCIHQNHVFRVRTDRTRILAEYMAALLRTQYAKHYFLSCAKRSSNLASVNSTQVKAFPVPNPPIALQRKFVAAVNQWDAATERLTHSLHECLKTYRSLQNRAFTGELTTEWEQANADAIARSQHLQERLPRLALLAMLVEAARRRGAAVLLTALMKYVFLLQMETNGRRRLYQFVPYHYGPFARELYADLERLQEEGLITVDNDTEEDKTRITTADPQRIEEVLGELPDDLREDVCAILDEYGELDHNRLLKTVYKKYPAYAKNSRLRKKATKKTAKRSRRPK